MLTITQAPNHASTWSSRQMARSSAMTGPRFETVALDKQPAPAAAIELIAAVPVSKINARTVACDGGGRALGHPKIYINLVCACLL
jgi:NADH dehydrogenase (ubiquinone) Fe-S protein 6